MNEHEKLLQRLGPVDPPRESGLAALLRIHRVVNDLFTVATTELLTTDLDLLEALIMRCSHESDATLSDIRGRYDAGYSISMGDVGHLFEALDEAREEISEQREKLSVAWDSEVSGRYVLHTQLRDALAEVGRLRKAVQCPRWSPWLASRVDPDWEAGDTAPTCSGEWVDGSGGHRKHKGACGVAAVWWHPDDMFSYCEDHVAPHDRPLYLRAWERTHQEGAVAALDEARAEVAQWRATAEGGAKTNVALLAEVERLRAHLVKGRPLTELLAEVIAAQERAEKAEARIAEVEQMQREGQRLNTLWVKRVEKAESEVKRLRTWVGNKPNDIEKAAVAAHKQALTAEARADKAEAEEIRRALERDVARVLARVLADAYQTDNRPPPHMVREALAFPVIPTKKEGAGE